MSFILFSLFVVKASDVVTDWYQESSRFKYGREPVSIQGIGKSDIRIF